jgi:hypothetical protein
MVMAVLAAGTLGCDEGIRSAQTPDLQLNPPEFRFGKLAAGSDADRTVAIQNEGTGDLRIASVQMALPNDEQQFELYWKESQDDNGVVGIDRNSEDQFRYPLVVPAGEIRYLVLNYRVPDRPDYQIADNPGQITMQTNVVSESFPDGAVTIPVRLSEGTPEINVAPGSIDFGRVPAEMVQEETVTITNIGQLNLEIRNILLNGSQDFVPLVEDDDGSLRDPRRIARDVLKELPPGEQMTVMVRYEPQVEGPDSAELSILSNDPNRSEVIVNLTANGATPCLKVIPPALEFRTSLVNRTDSRPLIIESCGGAPIEITGIDIRDDSDPAFRLDEASRPMLPAVLPAYDEAARDRGEPPPTRSLNISFTPREQRIHNGTLIIRSNDPVTPIREVSLLGRGVLNACPQARAAQEEFYVVPLDVVTLDGSPSIDQDGPNNRPVNYEWVITNRPEHSISQPHESFFDPAQPANGGINDDPATPNAVFFVDLAGTYTAELRVRDNLGLDSVACENPATVTIVAKPEEAVHIQLVWRTPNDPDETDAHGTDLDLHLLHPLADEWFAAPYDCYYENPVPEWGQFDNEDDDPLLDIDDINGAGPENTNLANPENTDELMRPYLVGVHYYSSHDRLTDEDYGASFATVRIFIRGELAWDYTDVAPQGDAQAGERELPAEDAFWDVAQITWPAGEVTTRDRLYPTRP